jgi:Tol biopolymer transport system component
MNASRRIAGLAALLVVSSCEPADQHPAQTQTAAPVRLASIVPSAASKTSRTSQDVTQRRLWNQPPDAEIYDISPDGRLIGYIDWETGDLAVRDLQTGTSRKLTRNCCYASTGDEVESVLFSPDGRQIAFQWWDAKTRMDELRVISIDGTGERTLLRSDDSCWPEAWTPDGKHILTYYRDSLVLVSTTGGPNRKLRGNLQWWRKYEISRDGRYVVASVSRRNGEPRTDLHILNLQTDRASVLLRNSAFTTPVGWTRDGRLVFASERGGTPGIWALRVVDGRAQGEPALIRGDLWNMDALTMSADGRVFYEVNSGDRDVFTAAFDPATGRVQSQPRSVTNAPGGNSWSPQWSPDGRYIGYVRSVPHEKARISVRSVEGDEVRELRPGLNNIRHFTWLPDGQTMMVAGRSDSSGWKLFRFDLRTGKTTQEVAVPTVPAFSKDGRFMYYVPELPNRDSVTATRLIERDLTNGKEREVYVASGNVRMGAVFALVDDGRTALVQFGPRRTGGGGSPAGFLAVSIQTGSARDLTAGIVMDSTTDPRMRAISITPDGGSVLVTIAKRGQPVWTQLWRVPLAGGAARRLADLPNIPGNGRQPPHTMLSPDGRRILYLAGHLATELWVLSDPQLADRSR